MRNLDLLVQLQQIDLEIGKRRCRCAKIKEEMKARLEGLRSFEAAVREAEAELEDNQRLRRKLERELEVKEAQEKKYKAQLFSVKTNKEYQSLQHEIELIRQECGRLEEEIIRLLEAADELNQNVRRKKDELEAERRRVAEEEAEKKRVLQAEEQAEQDLLERRKEVIAGIEPEWRKEYAKLAGLRDGLAVVAVRDSICQGCFIRVPPQTFEEIKRGERIYTCPSCLRILYYAKLERVCGSS